MPAWFEQFHQQFQQVFDRVAVLEQRGGDRRGSNGLQPRSW
jgi:hypothetical protein